MQHKTPILCALTLGLLGTSCLGPNNAYNSIRNWNAGLSDQDWVDEIAFIGLNIVPVYGLAYFGDLLIFNTIDYWSGNNPIGDPGEFPSEEFGG